MRLELRTDNGYLVAKFSEEFSKVVLSRLYPFFKEEIVRGNKRLTSFKDTKLTIGQEEIEIMFFSGYYLELRN